MNVTCPNCATLYRVDPAKVPVRGIRARCAVCSAVFRVQHTAAPAPVSAPIAAPTAISEPALVQTPAVQTPAVSASPVPPPVAAPSAPPASPRAVPVSRPVNPFLSQDPALKARRLARALISDMVVYHPAKRQEGLRDGTLKQLFEDEIKKSWEEYADQVGRSTAESTPYFREALNEILAGGKPVF